MNRLELGKNIASLLETISNQRKQGLKNDEEKRIKDRKLWDATEAAGIAGIPITIIDVNRNTRVIRPITQRLSDISK